MSGGVKVQASLAMEEARQIVAWLEPSCEVVEVAGSLRRGKVLVGDIEIVCVPRYDGLFDAAGESALERMFRFSPPWFLKWPPLKNGSRYKQFEVPGTPQLPRGFKLDLFITRRDSWGLQLALRTGPAEFSRQLVTQTGLTTGDGRAGLLRRGLRVADGSVWRGRLVDDDGSLIARGVPIPVETEHEFFSLIDGGWVEPEERE